MKEIEKLYSLAGVKKQLYCDICKAREHSLGLCAETKCDVFYPPFTAEKQIELIKWLIINRGLKPDYDEKEWGFCTYYIGGYYRETFEEALANLLNELWQDLTDTEKEQIKEILND